MGIRPGSSNPALGLPLFTDVADTVANGGTGPKVPLGTICVGYDDVAQRNNEYIYLQSPAAVVANNELTYDAAHLGTVVGAAAGQVFAINASGANQFTWFRLKRRGVIA
jgi:hypothetical protein